MMAASPDGSPGNVPAHAPRSSTWTITDGSGAHHGTWRAHHTRRGRHAGRRRLLGNRARAAPWATHCGWPLWPAWWRPADRLSYASLGSRYPRAAGLRSSRTARFICRFCPTCGLAVVARRSLRSPRSRAHLAAIFWGLLDSRCGRRQPLPAASVTVIVSICVYSGAHYQLLGYARVDAAQHGMHFS
jgi:hypothetical protein